ncbi:MAG TPA: HAMP domain-containing sensor histidine kinase [Gaiellales bacterium]|nr:HAMP domain-containing sensor histidine kinase [Gaiellales bacterium]
MRSLRLRLVVVLAAVVATAMGVVFLYVVPTLRENLISDRVGRLEQVGHREQNDHILKQEISQALQSGCPRTSGSSWGPVVRRTNRVGRLSFVRVSVFTTCGGHMAPVTATSLVDADDPVITKALASGFSSDRSGGRLKVAARVGPNTVVVLTQPVGDVNETSDLVERRIVIATGLALLVALLVGWGAAHAVTLRLARLEAGAQRIAVGDFSTPIGDTSPDELGQLARAFDTMQVRLDLADRVRKEFVANASHELRTPLFTLGGFMELLDDEDIDDATRADFLRQMREQVNRLTKLATDLLDLSRLDAGAFDVAHEPIDVAAAARGLVREFRGLAAGHGSRISLVKPSADLPNAIGDEQRVQQIGRALLDNAIRHNPDGTEVRVAVAAENGSVRLEVADDGRGIGPDTAQHLFERFYRGEATTASGSGLGLAIARELAERMDGRLELVSGDGETRFALTLPAEEAHS